MDIEKVKDTIFESIKHIDEEGKEYWLARELQHILKYKKWDKFLNVLNNAKIACKNSNIDTNRQFLQVGKLSRNVNGGERQLLDYRLSRYACYLIAMNGVSKKEVIALAQTYFAIKTRQQELREKKYDCLSEDEKRMYRRKKLNIGKNW